MSILITGARGTVGSYVAETAAQYSTPLILTDRAELDITNKTALEDFARKNVLSAIVNLAAYTEVDRAEAEREQAFRLNAFGPWNLALMSSALDIPLIHISTTQIFGGDGRTGCYSEFDQPMPVNAYAQSKWAGEQLVRTHAKKHFILRTCWVMGGGKADKKFVGKVVEKLKNHEPVQAVDDLYGSPTYAKDLAQLIPEIFNLGVYGTYHATNQGRATRLDMCLKLKEFLHSKSEIKGVSHKAFPAPAARPISEAADNWALRMHGFEDKMPNWEDALFRYVRNELANIV